MKLKLIRDIKKDTFTLGKLSINGEEKYFTVEDKDRDLENGGVKVKGQTAIPKGTYKVDITFSPKYKKKMPILLNVPQFTGVRIHSGNDIDDTEGCILVGMSRNETTGWISESRKAISELYPLLFAAYERNEPITIEIV